MLLKQMLAVVKLLGLRRAAGMKRRHERALPLVRGYATTTCLWTLLNAGFWDDLAGAASRAVPGPGRPGELDLAAYCKEKGFDLHVLDSICSYLDGVRLVDYDHDARRVRLARRGRDLLAEPRGLFELLYAYEPVFVDLEAMLRGAKVYGRDVRRRTRWVGLGSGRLCRQLPYPVMIDMVCRHGRRRVLDLGCGDGALLIELAKRQANVSGIGIDLDAATVELANEQIAAAGLADRLTALTLDMFGLTGERRGHPYCSTGESDGPPGGPETTMSGQKTGMPPFSAIDCLTACDTFHEYLWQGDQPIVQLLGALKKTFPAAILVVGEFCKQSHETLRKRPTAFLEHHLFHQLTNQRIESADRWRDIFARAGLRVVEEKVFDLVGHGYFVLE